MLPIKMNIASTTRSRGHTLYYNLFICQNITTKQKW
ncbi:hypothetical protein V6Z12_A11G353700 [Gossypium hirsutum]